MRRPEEVDQEHEDRREAEVGALFAQFSGLAVGHRIERVAPGQVILVGTKKLSASETYV